MALSDGECNKVDTTKSLRFFDESVDSIGPVESMRPWRTVAGRWGGEGRPQAGRQAGRQTDRQRACGDLQGANGKVRDEYQSRALAWGVRGSLSRGWTNVRTAAVDGGFRSLQSAVCSVVGVVRSCNFAGGWRGAEALRRC